MVAISSATLRKKSTQTVREITSTVYQYRQHLALSVDHAIDVGGCKQYPYLSETPACQTGRAIASATQVKRPLKVNRDTTAGKEIR